MAVAASQRYSIDDLAQFPDDGKLRELSDGRLVEWDVTTIDHGAVTNWLAFLVTAFVHQHRLGTVVTTDALIRVLGSDYSARGGDIVFFARGRLPANRRAAASEVAPDFVIEILSPSDQAREVQAKVRDWLRAGVRLLWYVEPESGVTTVYRGNGGTFVGPDEELSGEDVVPGFTLRLGDVLAELAADEAADEPGAAPQRDE